MALPSSGALSLDDIQGEFGGTNPISIDEYYGVATGVPTSGTISINDFYGTSADTQTSDAYWANTVFFSTMETEPVTQLVSGGPSISIYYGSMYGLDGLYTAGGLTGSRIGHNGTLGDPTLEGIVYYFSNPITAYSGDFTIEFWIYSLRSGNSPDGADHLLSNTSAGAYSSGRWKLLASNRYFFVFDTYEATPSGTRTLNTWQHVAVSRSSGTVRTFVDGVLQDTFTNSNSFGSSSNNIWIGALSTGIARYTSDAYIRQVRMTKAARYTANFNPFIYFYYPGIA